MSLADHAENALLDHALGRITYARPSSVHMELFTRSPDDAGVGGAVVPLGAGYQGRLALANNAVVFPGSKQGVKYNGVSLPFGTPSALGWGALAGVGLYDAPTGGNLLVYFELVAPVSPKSGIPLVLHPGDLYLKLSGGWDATFSNNMLDHLLGGPDFVPPAIWYFGLRVNGVELTDLGYARRPAPNNALNFPVATAGTKANGQPIVFGPASVDWVVSTEWAVYSVATGGTASMAARLALALPVLATESTTFDPGDFAFSLD